MSNNVFTSDAELLRNAISRYGLPIVLTAVFGRNFRVQIPVSAGFLDNGITILNLSCRAVNALMRADIPTIGSLIESVENDTLQKIRNLGAKSIKEIKTKLLVTAYELLSPAEQVQFCNTLLKLNQ